jgi:hypothetical protein
VDYSNEKIRSITESVLNESRGLNASRNWPIFQNSSDDDRDTWTDGTPIDWNGDQEIDDGTVTLDIESFNRSKENSFEVLECYEDWANLNLIPANCPVDGGGVTIPVDEMADEQTYEEAQRAAAESDFDGDGVSSLEDKCPQIPNPGQAEDGVGDACDPGDIDLVADLEGPRTHYNGSVRYTATLTHSGADPATEVTLAVDVPWQVRLQSVSVTGASCGFAGGALTCEAGSLAPGETVETTIEGGLLAGGP